MNFCKSWCSQKEFRQNAKFYPHFTYTWRSQNTQSSIYRRPHDWAHTWFGPTRLIPHDCAQTRLCPDTIVLTHDCAHTWLCPDTIVPRHVCAQTRLCPHTFVPTHDCAHTWLCPHTIVLTHDCAHTRLCTHTILPKHVCAQTRLCPDTFVPTHVCVHTRLCPHTFVPTHVCTQIVWSQSCLGRNVYVCVQTCYNKITKYSSRNTACDCLTVVK